MAIETFDEGELWYFLYGGKTDSYFAPYQRGNDRHLDDEEVRRRARPPQLRDTVLQPSIHPESNALDFELAAILDSGVDLNHPLLRSRIEEWKDFTGEGPEDVNGHGTFRALITLHKQPTARLVVAKVFGKHFREREGIISALAWAKKKGAGVAWLALGEYNASCQGDCPLCRAARDAADFGCVVLASPGNRVDAVACPSKARGVVPFVTTEYHLRDPFDLLDRLQRVKRIPNYFEYIPPSS
jgi:hypothetical protein